MEKKKIKKNQLFLENSKILHSYWNENLNPLRCQLSKMF